MWCPDCQLTPAAADLIRRALDEMQRTRPGDDAWRPLICGRCGEVTGLTDERDGWLFGIEPDGQARKPEPAIAHAAVS